MVLDVERCSARSLSASTAPSKPLGVAALAALIFFNVCGGPFGCEETVSAGGPFVALLGYTVMPLVWSIPEALITAELAMLFPTDSGYVAWVTAAFGPTWGFYEGFFSWLSGVADNAVYPGLFYSYARVLLPQTWHETYDTTFVRVVVVLTFTMGNTVVNYRGLEAVGPVVVVMAALTVVPFIIMAVVAVPQIEPARWFDGPHEIDYIGLLNILFWNLNYWDSVSTVAGEVNHVSDFPKALAVAVVMVISAYVVPLLVAIGVTPSDQVDVWTNGYLGKVGSIVGGPWMGASVALAAAVSAIGQFQSEMSSCAYQLLGMSEQGWLPRGFARRSRTHNAPVLALALDTTIIVTCTIYGDFDSIVELLNGLYCIAELIEFAAFLKLRWSHSDLPRPYKIPLNFVGCVCMLTPPCILCVVILVLPTFKGSYTTPIIVLSAIVLGAIVRRILEHLRRVRPSLFLRDPPAGVEALLEPPSPDGSVMQHENGDLRDPSSAYSSFDQE